MKKLVTLIIVCLLLVGCTTSKQESKTYSVAVLQFVKHDALDAATQGFVDTLKQKYGDLISIKIENASGDIATTNVIASNLVNEGYDLILANATPCLQSLANATNQIPILGTSITEYGTALEIENFNGLVGTNISGTSDLAPLDEQANMFIELIPDAKTIGLLYCLQETNSLYQVNVVKSKLESLGLNAILYPFSDSNDISHVVEQMCSQCDAIYIPTDNTAASNGQLINSIATDNNKPIIAGEKQSMIAFDAIASISIDYYNLGQITANMAIDILDGNNQPSKMEIQYDTNPIKYVNVNALKRLNLEMVDGYIEFKE